MNENAPPRLRYPWYVALVAARPERAKAPTALEDALLSAVERAIHDRRHPLHQQTFGFYDAPEKVSGSLPGRDARQKEGTTL
jgi:hypothetical protein